LEKWEQKAEKAAGEIYLLVENDQRVHFRGHEEDPIKMWELLVAAHLFKKPGARFNTYDDLFNIRKQNDETLVDLGVRIEKAMQTIQNLRPADFTIDKLDAELQCMALIRSLPEEYQHLSTSLLLKDELDKSTILQAFRSEELNHHRHTIQAESLNQAKAGGRGGKGNNRFKKSHKDTSQLYKDTSHKDPPKDYSQVLCFICQKLGHMSHNCSRVQDRKVVKGSESAKKAEGSSSDRICWSGKCCC
jgi:hypothetical protein